MNLYKRKQNPEDIFIVDVLAMSVQSYKASQELSIITASQQSKENWFEKISIITHCTVGREVP